MKKIISYKTGYISKSGYNLFNQFSVLQNKTTRQHVTKKNGYNKNTCSQCQ